ncbi:hypothetical protein [Streptosporangium sp. NPDC003464]
MLVIEPPATIVRFEFSTRTPPASFRPLSDRFGARVDHVVDPLEHPGLHEEVVPVDAQARHWAGAVRSFGGPPYLLFGHCSAVSLVRATLRRLPAHVSGRAIVFDPSVPTAATVADLMREITRKYCADTGWVEEIIPSAWPGAAGFPAEFAAGLARRLLAEHDLPADIAADLAARQARWISYCASASVEPGDEEDGDRIVAVLTDEAGEWRGAADAVIRVAGGLPAAIGSAELYRRLSHGRAPARRPDGPEGEPWT